MKRLLFLIVACSAWWGCSDDTSPSGPTGSSSSSGGGGASSSSSSSSASSGSGGSGGTGGAAPLAACLDSPDALPRPPSGALPCEYIPPGVVLPQ